MIDLRGTICIWTAGLVFMALPNFDEARAQTTAALDSTINQTADAEIEDAATELAKLLAANKFAISTATVEGGRLMITGTTKGKKKKVKLDGQYQTKSGADRVFSFDLIYLPADCIAKLTSGGKTIGAVIQNCGPVGPKGAKGKTGKKGTKGNAGPKGNAGSKGNTGDQGPQGNNGSAGPAGPAGPQGSSGVVQVLQGISQTSVPFTAVTPGTAVESGCAVSITTTGGPVMIHGSLPIEVTYNGNGTVAANVLRDGVNIAFDYRWVEAIPLNFGGYTTANVQWLDEPVAGTYLYTLELTFSNLANGGNLNNSYPCSLIVTEY